VGPGVSPAELAPRLTLTQFRARFRVRLGFVIPDRCRGRGGETERRSCPEDQTGNLSHAALLGSVLTCIPRLTTCNCKLPGKFPVDLSQVERPNLLDEVIVPSKYWCYSPPNRFSGSYDREEFLAQFWEPSNQFCSPDHLPQKQEV